MKYYSQIEQDKYFIEEIIKFKKNGRFLDVGANDGITESNTYCLEKEYEWSGICVEANEDLAKVCACNRPLSMVSCSVVWSKETTLDFAQPKNNLLSRINNLVWNNEYFSEDFVDVPVFKRTTTTIKNILGDSKQKFDYFSLDIEGAELEALKGIDWNNTEFSFMTIEHGNRSHYQNLIASFLNSVGYKIHRINRWDMEFVPK